MKKIIVSLLLLFVLPIMVNGDAGGPVLTEYDVKVTNPNGTLVERWNDETGEMEKVTLPYGTIIKGVMFETLIDGDMYGYTSDGTIKLADCEVVTTEFDFEKFYNDPGKLYVYKEGAYLYKGPSKSYEKVNDVMLPVGTIIEYQYHDDLFAYVTYKGVSGWVYYYQRYMYEGSGPYVEGSSLATIEDGKVYILANTKMYSDPVNGTELNQVIPKNEIINYKYTYNPYIFINSYYVTYKGVSGWITNDNSNIAKNYKGAKFYSFTSTAKLCETPSEKCKEIGTIPTDTMLDIDYMLDNLDLWVNVTYKGVSGWVYFDAYEDNNYKFAYYPSTIKLKNEISVYDKINGKETSKLEVGNYKVYDYYIFAGDNYEYRWIYLSDKDSWIYANDNDIEFIPDEVSSSNTMTNLPLKTIVLYCVAGAIIISLTTIVIIKLINKKRVNNNQ